MYSTDHRRPFYQLSSSSLSLQLVDSSLSSLSLLYSVSESIGQNTFFSGTQKLDRQNFLVIIQDSTSISIILLLGVPLYMYRPPFSPNVALAYCPHGDTLPGVVLVLVPYSRSIVASLPVVLRPSGVACFGRPMTAHHRYAVL